MDAADTERAFGLCQEIGKLLYVYMSASTRRFGHLPGFVGLLIAAGWVAALVPSSP